MVDQPLIVFSGMGLLIGMFVFLVYKIYQNRQRVSTPVLHILLGAALCLIIWVIAVVSRPLSLWQRIVTANAAQYGALLYYIALKHMFTNRRSTSLLKNQAFWITTLSVLTIIVLDIYLRAQPVFDGTTPLPLHQGWMFYTEAALSYSNLLYLNILIISVYVESLQRNIDTSDQGRLWLFLLAFLISGLGLLLADINLFLFLAGDGNSRIFLNSLYHLALVISALMVVLAYTLPDIFFLKLFRPLVSYRLYRLQQQQTLLRQLHQVMVKIVPDVQLACEQAHDLRVLIEISDARQVIWSQQQRTAVITPQDEARHLLHLLHKNVVLATPGEHQPPPTRHKPIVKHNVLTARHLKSLQKPVPTQPDSESPESFQTAQPSRRKRSWMKIILTSLTVTVTITLIATVALTWYLCNYLMYPKRLPITRTPTIPYEEIQLYTTDHVNIRGWFIPAPLSTEKAPAILLLHGVADNRNV
ncbi:MAG: hypothetical protein JO031_07235, partial [Ktedonobacteraceae bacterium]|nr:hypothetical protein [Ktedonobacteraceae bacterium]